MKRVVIFILAAIASSAFAQAQDTQSQDTSRNPYAPMYYTDREPAQNLIVGMKYKQLKQIYDFRDFSPAAIDRYSPAWSGVASFFIPGLGQMICNEPGRGLGFLGGSIGCSLVGSIALVAGAQENAYTGELTGIAPAAVITAMLAYTGALAIDIISIVDGVRVAKVKDMYEQDLKKLYSVQMDLYPSVNYALTGNGYKPTAGMTLAVRF